MASAHGNGEHLRADAGSPELYDELRRIARAYLSRERPDHTLRPTELVNEAYLRLARSPDLAVDDRSHFFALAARAMRRILVDHARGRARVKRGGGRLRVTLTAGSAAAPSVDAEGLLDLDRALARLESLDARQARVVELRFFAGFSMSEIADALDVSKRTVEGDWAHARAWLRRELQSAAPL